jgi:methyl-accepting chemotaxis protein
MNRIGRWLGTLSIKAKILAGFACVLAILLAVAGIGYWRFQGVADSLRSYVQRVGVVEASRIIDREFTEMRRHVREFAFTGNPDEATSAMASANRMKIAIEKGLAVMSSPERQRHMHDIAARYDDYRKSVDTVFAMKREKDKLVSDALDPTGQAAREDFDSLIASAPKAGKPELVSVARDAQQALMRLRLNGTKIIDRQRDETAAKKAQESEAELRRLVQLLDVAAAGPELRATLDALRQHLDAYTTAYHKAVQLTQDLDQRVYGSMTHDAEVVAMEAVAVTNSAVTEQAAIEAETLDGISATGQLMLVLAASGLVLGLAVAWLIGGGISRPVRKITDAMHQLASGELEAEIPALDRGDEVGQMAQAMLVFRRNAQEARRLQGEAERVRAAKDRRQSAMDAHTQDFGTSASGVMATLVGAADAMRGTATKMTEAAHHTRDTAAQTAEGAEGAARSVGMVAAAAEELSASIHEISQQVARATQAAQEAVERASMTDTKVGGMAEAAERVGNVVRLISDIAGQTNLLALNATIEAARAGDAGKGFAVVAGEVKALAAQTAKATEEISSQIAAIRGATGEAVSAVREVTASISQVSEVASAIAAAVEEQTATTREIAQNAQSVLVVSQDATRAMQDVSSVSETAEAASESVKQNADEVGRTADVLRSELTMFLEAMAKTEDDDRRRYERISGNGTLATLHAAKHEAMRVAINDISRGGVALRCDWHGTVGEEVKIELPGGDDAVVARMVRNTGGVLALTFRQDAAMLRRVDAALEHIGRQGLRAAA